MSQPTCPFCPSGEPLAICRCPDARYSRTVGFPSAKAEFLRHGGMLRGSTTSESLEAAKPEPAPAVVPVDQVSTCAFCGKGEHEVGYLFKGLRASICNDCVVLGIEEWGVRLGSLKNYAHRSPNPEVGASFLRLKETLRAALFGAGDSTPTFHFNEDGQPPTNQPRGICPSCDKRRDYAAKSKGGAQ